MENAKKAAQIRQANSPIAGGLKPGPKPVGGVSRAERAKDIGVPEETPRRAEQHVDLAERYPWLQSEEWRQSDVLRLRRHLQRIPVAEHDALCQFIEKAAEPFHPRVDRVEGSAEVPMCGSAEVPLARSG